MFHYKEKCYNKYAGNHMTFSAITYHNLKEIKLERSSRFKGKIGEI